MNVTASVSVIVAIFVVVVGAKYNNDDDLTVIVFNSDNNGDNNNNNNNDNNLVDGGTDSFYADFLARKEPKIYFDEQSVSVQKGNRVFVDLVLLQTLEDDAVVNILFYDDGVKRNSSNGVLKDIKSLTFKANYNRTKAQVKAIPVAAINVGEATLVLHSTSPELASIPNFNHTFVVVDVIHSNVLKTLNFILGWTYMVCWGVSYYPQLYLNFKTWSVAGFSVDYGLLNVIAYSCYTAVMCSLYWSPYIQAIYFREHPHTQIPVEVPDLASVIHNTIVIGFLGLQCVFLPRGGQRLSRVSWCVLVLFVVAPLSALPFAASGLMDWLSFVHVFSYIKIGISLIKYAPQAFMNWRRKSTAGYSPVNICLDFSGSSFLVLQLIFLSANRNDIWSLIGNPAKFGVGFASWIFTGIFMIQNFILYRNQPAYLLVDCDHPKGYNTIQ